MQFTYKPHVNLFIRLNSYAQCHLTVNLFFSAKKIKHTPHDNDDDVDVDEMMMSIGMG